MALNREKVVRSAEKYVSRGKLEAAIKEYRKVLAENPNDANTLNRVGDLYARIERFGEAVKLFTQIAEQYTRDGFFVKAIAIYKKIIKLDPTSLPVYERLAELYYRQGLLNEARTQYQVLADYYQKHDNATSAITIYQKMSQMEPENPSFHLKLAELYGAQRLNDKALDAYRQLADLLIVNGSVEEATQVYLKALEFVDGDSQFVRRAVAGLHDGGHVGAAAQVLARATELDPAAAGLAEEIGIAGGPAASEPVLEPVLEESDDAFVIPETSFDDLESLEEGMLEVSPASQEALPVEDGAFPPPSFGEESVFTFDIDDDEVPDTLVQPPADVLGREAPAAAEEVEFELDLEDETVVPAADLPPGGVAAAPEVEIDWSLDELELPEAELEPREGAPEEEDLSLELEEAELFAEGEPAAAPAPGVLEPLAAEVEEVEAAVPEPQPATGTPDRGTPDRGPPAVRREEDLLAEARVFAKYGLEEKALDRLRELFDIRPDHLEGLELQARIHLQAGRHEKAVAGAKEVSRVATETGNLEPWRELRDELLKAGYSVDDDRIAREPEEERPAEDDRIAQLLEDLSLEDFEQPAAGKPAAPVVAAAPPPEAAPPPVDVPGVEAPAVEPPPVEPPAVEPPGEAADGKKLVSLVDELGLEDLQDELADVAPPPEPPVADVAESAAESPEPPEAAPPPAAAEAPPEPPEPASEPPEPTFEPALESVDQTGMSWLDELAPEGPEAVDETAALFEEEDDFFDLAAELERELSQDDLQGAVIQPQEQSLEDIIEGFKQGVAENLSPEDYETHFNLGIAYREMGLLDEAIGEFQLAAKDERYVVDCSSLLGNCFLEKGLPELAVRWFRRGLESPSINPEATMGLLYEMGDAYLTLGDSEAAYKTFSEVHGLNSNYRDITAKLQELQAS